MYNLFFSLKEESIGIFLIVILYRVTYIRRGDYHEKMDIHNCINHYTIYYFW